MSKTSKVLSLAEFKSAEGITRLDVYTGKTSGKRYACDQRGDFIGMLAEDFDSTKAIVVFYMQDEESGETWKFIANGEPRQPEFTL